LNVPPPDDTKFSFWLRKTKWVAIAVFAPEIVVVNAFLQWTLARRFIKEPNEVAGKCHDEKFKVSNLLLKGRWRVLIFVQSWYTRRHNRFDMVYDHYAVMGGFTADVENIHNMATRVTITHNKVLLAKNGPFCQANRSYIQDKSKADILAKGLVYIQVLWVADQAIERKLSGYPITLLEIHTLVHVCDLIMYGLWAQKPLNVQDPTLVTFEEDPESLAFMLETSQSYFAKRYHGFSYPNSETGTFKGEFIMVLLNKVEPKCVHFNHFYEGLPQMITEVVIQDKGHDLVQISTYYCLSSTD
jgi:hypothetical protein